MYYKKTDIMKKIVLSLLACTFALASSAQTNWNVDNTHSNVNFVVTHLVVSEVQGSFKTYEGKVTSPSPDFNNAQITFSVDVNSVNTENEMRDKHLKSDDFFNAEKYPTMNFKSVTFKKVDAKNYKLEGDLTIRSVTNRVKFDVTYGGTTGDGYGNTKAGFQVKGTINRKDYGLLWSKTTEAGGLVVSDEVSIAINLELVQAK